MAGSKKKILFLVPYPYGKAPSQRLKFEQYYSFFRESGFQVITSSFVSDRFWKILYKKGFLAQKIFYTAIGYCRRFFDLFRVRRYDIVYVHLWATPLGPPVYEWLICLVGKKLIYDIDDLVYLPASKSKANKLAGSFKGKNKPIYLMKHADHVITCTPYLDNFVCQYNQHTTDISSTINTDIYRPRQDYIIKNRPVILGWSGSHSTSKYLHLLDPVFRRLKSEGVSFRLLVMGDPDFTIEGIDVEALPWKESYETEVISRFDIGLYPLPDEQWVYGKSGLKALQYMAAGVPTVASAIGANFRIIENGKNGFLASNEEEWASLLYKLIGDESLRRTIGLAGAGLVEEKFSVKSNKDIYLSILKSVLKEN